MIQGEKIHFMEARILRSSGVCWKMHWLKLAVFILLLYANDASSHSINMGCKPRKVVKNIVKVNVMTHPRTVVVYECSGYKEAKRHVRRNFKCVPTETGLINKQFYLYSTNELGNKTFVNHTRCEMKCICELNSYQCAAKYKFHGEVPCPDGSSWNKDHCECKPICPTADKGSRGPVKDEGITPATLVASLIGELIIIVIVIYVIKDCRTHGCIYRQLNRSTSTLRRSNSASLNGVSSPNEKTNLSGSET